MKRTLFFALTAAAVMSTQAQNPNVFFSEYVEGSSNNKALEIYNGTGAAIDLGNYRIASAANGAGYTNNYQFASGTTVAAGDVYVVAHSSSAANILAVADLTINATPVYFNGNDARALEYLPTGATTWVQLDVIADPNSNSYPDVAGVSQGTQNRTIRRKTTITTGNTDFSVSAGTDATSSEWEVFAQDNVDDLGSFGTATSTDPEISFNNSADTVFMNVFSADLPVSYDFYYSFDNFEVGVDGLIKYAYIDASSNLTFDTTSTGLFSLDLTEFGTHTVAVGFTDLAGLPTMTQDTIVIVLSETQITDVATIADLRAQAQGSYYRLTGEAVITYLQSFRNQKYIQDATAAILIDDNDGVITGTFNVYDGLTNLTGELTSYNGLMQFKPSEDMTTASSTGNTVTPVVITVDDLNNNIDDHESELVQIQTATVTGDTSNFVNGTNYTITDASGSGVFRTQFYGVDYIGTAIPGASHYTGIAIRYNSTAQLVSRDLMDICEIDYTVGTVNFTTELNSTDQSEFTADFTAPTGFASYSWDFGDGSAVSADQNPTHAYASNGSFTVELTVTNHCGIEKTVTETVVVEGVGIEEYTAFTMFPVPAQDVLNVAFTNDTEKVVSIFNTLGVKVAEQNVTSNAVINTSVYTSGIYVMVITENGKTTAKRFVVK